MSDATSIHVSCGLLSDDATSIHVVSCGLLSDDATSIHVVSCGLLSDDAMSIHVVSCGLLSDDAMSIHVVSCGLLSDDATSIHVVSCGLLSDDATSIHRWLQLDLAAQKTFAAGTKHFDFKIWLSQDNELDKEEDLDLGYDTSTHGELSQAYTSSKEVDLRSLNVVRLSIS